MSVQSRERLKSYFRNGNLAKEEYFVDLIDSSVNKTDDLINANKKNGLELSPDTNSNRLISFFKNSSGERTDSPSFAFQLTPDKNGTAEGLSLAIPNGNTNELKNLIVFKTEKTNTGAIQGRIGIKTDKPAFDMDVNGSIGMKARIGRYNDPKVEPEQILADGKWHKLLTNLKGFNSFEILSVAYSPDGKYAMSYNLLINAFGKKGRIVPKEKVYKRWWHRIQMRWVSESGGMYGLEVRTRCNYNQGQLIHNRITQLWI